MQRIVFILTLCIWPALPFHISAAPNRNFLRRPFGTTQISSSPNGDDSEVRLEDRNVPTGNKRLHDALHSDGEAYGSEEAHGPMSPTEVDEAFNAQNALPPPPPPTLTEDRVLPYQVLLRGLEGSASKVAAVYAVYSSPSGAASACCHVGLTRNLAVALRSHANSDVSDKCKTVRAASFKYPQQTAMEEMRLKWIKDFEWDGAVLEEVRRSDEPLNCVMKQPI